MSIDTVIAAEPGWAAYVLNREDKWEATPIIAWHVTIADEDGETGFREYETIPITTTTNIPARAGASFWNSPLRDPKGGYHYDGRQFDTEEALLAAAEAG